MREGQEPQLVAALRAAMAAAVARGVSLREMSRQSGVHTMSVTRFYKGERDLTAANAGRLAAVLGLVLVPTAKKGGRTGRG